jgi:hypothetical protein
MSTSNFLSTETEPPVAIDRYFVWNRNPAGFTWLAGWAPTEAAAIELAAGCYGPTHITDEVAQITLAGTPFGIDRDREIAAAGKWESIRFARAERQAA